MKAAHSFVFVRLGLLRWAAVIIINFHSLISDNHALTRLCLIKTKMIMIWVIAISRLVRSPIPDSSSHYIGPQKWTALLIDAQSQLISSFITAISFGWNTNTRQPCSPLAAYLNINKGRVVRSPAPRPPFDLFYFFYKKNLFCRIKSDRQRSSIQLARTAGRKVHARTNFLFFSRSATKSKMHGQSFQEWNIAQKWKDFSDFIRMSCAFFLFL